MGLSDGEASSTRADDLLVNQSAGHKHPNGRLVSGVSGQAHGAQSAMPDEQSGVGDVEDKARDPGNNPDVRRRNEPDIENQIHQEEDDVNAPLLGDIEAREVRGGGGGDETTQVSTANLAEEIRNLLKRLVGDCEAGKVTGGADDDQTGQRSRCNLAESEIRNLLWIEANPIYSRALRTWEEKDKLFASRIDSKRKQSMSVRNEIYQLVGFYSVFQGVLLTAVSQSNLLHCHNWWSAFFLSALASVVTIAGVLQKFLTVWELEKTIGSEEGSRQECIHRVQYLTSYGPRFDFAIHAKDGKRPDKSSTNLEVSTVAVIGVIIIFSALFLASIQRILCNSGPSPPA